MKRKGRKRCIAYMTVMGCMMIFLAACGTAAKNGLGSQAGTSSYGQAEAQPAKEADEGQPANISDGLQEDTGDNQPEKAADGLPESAAGDLPESEAGDSSGNSDLVKEILTFSNQGFLSDRIEYTYTAEGLVEKKREYFATEDTYQPEEMTLLQETVYTYDERGRVSSEQVFDGEGKLIADGVYNYDETYDTLTSADFRDKWGGAIVNYQFAYTSTGPVVSGEYIWNHFRDIYFNGHVKYVCFQFGANGEIVECLAYSSGDFTTVPECAIGYTCDDNGVITGMTYRNITDGWGSYSCEYERSSRGIESISYSYLSGESMRLETYQYDDQDRISGIDVTDEETGESYRIIYHYE